MTNNSLSPFDLLPIELKYHIFDFLNLKARGNATGVCVEWKDLINRTKLSYKNALIGQKLKVDNENYFKHFCALTHAHQHLLNNSKDDLPHTTLVPEEAKGHPHATSTQHVSKGIFRDTSNVVYLTYWVRTRHY